MIDSQFLSGFKQKTEERWRRQPLNPQIYGFQFQTGTRWNPGLSDSDIQMYENDVGVRFPSDFKAFLGVMNGTDRPTLNLFGGSGEPPREGVGVYRFPQDLELVRGLIASAVERREVLTTTLLEEGITLSEKVTLMPIYAHRYVVCDEDPGGSLVLSIWECEDAIVYGRSLQEYLEREFLGLVPDWVSGPGDRDVAG